MATAKLSNGVSVLSEDLHEGQDYDGVTVINVLQQLPEHVEIGLGCVSCPPGVVDSVDTIVQRVEQTLQYIAPERITLNPECGFAPGSAAVVSIDEVYTKLKNEVSAAKRRREKYAS